MGACKGAGAHRGTVGALDSPQAGLTDCYELSDVGARNQTQAGCKNNMHS